MNASTVNTSNVQILDPNNTSVPIGSITTGGANTFVFSPASPLASNTKYIIKFGTGIQDTFGTSLPQTLRYAFTGTSITPVGLMLNPVNNATGVSRTSSLSLWFSENMNATTINSSTVQLAAVIAPSISIPITVSGSGNSYTVTPIGTLLPNTQYMLTFTTSIQDTSGNAMSALSQAQYFTTGN
ncbi:MAG: hypothetical protein K0R14_118 [Burkholderiales bacterium]|jgi:hypothetical protein|nr:hypothetical protein [Burkholderiales bacterium]